MKSEFYSPGITDLGASPELQEVTLAVAEELRRYSPPDTDNMVASINNLDEPITADDKALENALNRAAEAVKRARPSASYLRFTRRLRDAPDEPLWHTDIETSIVK